MNCTKCRKEGVKVRLRLIDPKKAKRQKNPATYCPRCRNKESGYLTRLKAFYAKAINKKGS